MSEQPDRLTPEALPAINLKAEPKLRQHLGAHPEMLRLLDAALFANRAAGAAAERAKSEAPPRDIWEVGGRRAALYAAIYSLKPKREYKHQHLAAAYSAGYEKAVEDAAALVLSEPLATPTAPIAETPADVRGKVLKLARALDHAADNAPTDMLPGVMREVSQKLFAALATHPNPPKPDTPSEPKCAAERGEDPRGCWNVRCQLGGQCKKCDELSAKSARVISELHKAGMPGHSEPDTAATREGPSDVEQLTGEEVSSIFETWNWRPDSTPEQLIRDCYALGRHRALSSRPEGEPMLLTREQFYTVVRSALLAYRAKHPSRYLNSEQVDADDSDFVSALADEHAAAPAQPPQPQGALTEAQIVLVARLQCKRVSEACNVDNDDSWKTYGDTYIEDARAISAALAASTKEQA